MEGGPKASLESPVWSFQVAVAHEEEIHRVAIITESGEALNPGVRAKGVVMWFFGPPVGSNVKPDTGLQLWVADRVVGDGRIIAFERSVELDS